MAKRARGTETVRKKAMEPSDRLGVWVSDPSLSRWVRSQRRARRDKTLSKTIGDLLRERMAIHEVVGRGGRLEMVGDQLILGRIVDVNA